MSLPFDTIWLAGLVVAVTILLWATTALPEYLTALLFFTAAMVLGVAPPEVVFGGFMAQAFWLVLSGFVIGVAMRKVGLADRLAALLATRITQSWPRMVGGVVLICYLLAFIMPSNRGRIALLMPIVASLGEQAGLTAGSRGRIGLALAVAFGTFQLSASILPANVPNLVMAGAAEGAFGLHLSYVPYFVLHTPVVGLLKGLLVIACICLMFPATPRPLESAPRPAPMSGAEKRLTALLLTTLLLWMTDSLHGISPAWVGMASACFCLLPRMGFLTGDEFAQGVNFRTCLYVAGILAMAGVVTHSGLGALMGDALLRVLPLDPATPATNFASLIGVTALMNFVVTANGVPALYTTFAEPFAQASGFSLMTVIMIQVIAYATPLLPYQASPLVLAMALGKVPVREGIRVCLVLAALTAVFLLPLHYLWFRALGWIG